MPFNYLNSQNQFEFSAVFAPLSKQVPPLSSSTLSLFVVFYSLIPYALYNSTYYTHCIYAVYTISV